MTGEVPQTKGQQLPITETLMVSLRYMASNWVYLLAVLILAFVLMSVLLIVFGILARSVAGGDPLSSAVFFIIAFFLSTCFVMTAIAGPSLYGDWRTLLVPGRAMREMRRAVGVWLWANVATFVACLPAAALGIAIGGPALAVPFALLVAIFLQVRFFLAIPSALAVGRVTLQKTWVMTEKVPWPTLALFSLATIISFVLSTALSFPLVLLERISVGPLGSLGSLESTRVFFMNFAVALCVNTISAANAFRWLDYYSDTPLLNYDE